MRHFALLCLGSLCAVHAENQRRLRKAGGVGVLLTALAGLRCVPRVQAPKHTRKGAASGIRAVIWAWRGRAWRRPAAVQQSASTFTPLINTKRTRVPRFAGFQSAARSLDSLLPSPYAVALLDCVADAVVPDRKSAARFLVEQVSP